MVKLGVVGLGVIGKAVVKAADAGRIPVQVPVATTRTPGKVASFLQGLRTPPALSDIEGVVQGADVILEAAGVSTVAPICEAALPLGKEVIITSIGALLDREDLVALAERGGGRIYAPSCAIIGLDGLKAAREGRLDSVTMTTRKPPASLAGAPYVVEQGIDLARIQAPEVIFEGDVLEACRGFPANVNVSAAVALAGIGPRRTRIRIFCDPTIQRNIHEVEAVGAHGRFFFRIENVPSENHRTGIMTYLSVLALMRERESALVIGT
ncbi:MAG: aspartate dehydrogenase [bacterium]|nr:aspartate dehydrogenase [bacterium]